MESGPISLDPLVCDWLVLRHIFKPKIRIENAKNKSKNAKMCFVARKKRKFESIFLISFATWLY